MRRHLLALAFLTLATGAVAQVPIPGLAKPAAAETPKAAPAESPEQARARLQAQLDEARAERQRLEDEIQRGTLPAGITDDDAVRLRRALDETVFAIEGRLRLAADLTAAQRALAQAEQAQREWTGFAEPPPYSALMVDRLRDEAALAGAQVAALEGAGLQATREVGNLKKRIDAAEADVRRLREARERAKSGTEAAADWQLAAAQRTARAAAALAALAQLSGEVATARAGAERARLALLQRKIAVAASQERFDESDLTRLRADTRVQTEQLRKQLDEAIARSNRRARERERAAQAAGTAVAGSAEAAALQATLRAADARAETARFEVDALSGEVTVADAREELARLRFEAGRSADAAERRRVLAQLTDIQTKAAQWVAYAQNQRDLARLAESRETQRLLAEGQSQAASSADRDLLAALQARVELAERLVRNASQTERSLQRWVDELGAEKDNASFNERAVYAAAGAAAAVKSLWNFELFATEDSTTVDGQRITTTRGVTVGKSVGAVLIFVLGMLAASALARRLEGALVRRARMSAPQARTIKRWLLALTAAVMVVVVLNLARIPLTVFAFLGGALAIGVGFGTQTLIKNFISGLIVLMERQVRVGDIIEVDGTTGTVTEVNLRSSTVRAFDGVEAMVPNATLLEQKVVNWTQSDLKVRRAVRVGVAYGSPVREVSDILLECAQRHGLILKDPAPYVLFEDFGDSALVFSLFFWLELTPNVNSSAVMSDLRYMIEKRFGEAGIEIAFPQREVRLATTKPLEVRLTPRTGEQPAA